jgi:hypothetical protein
MMVAMAKRIFIVGLLAGLSACLVAQPVEAATSTSLGFAVSPPTVELAAEPGQAVKSSVKIINLTDLPLSLSIERRSFVARGDEGQVDLVENNPLYTLAPWFHISSATIEVAPRDTKLVEFSVAVPPNAQPGGRYGSLVFKTKKDQLSSGQSGAAVSQELGALIFLRVLGNANEQLAIGSFGPQRQWYEHGPVNFEASIKNVGNVHAKPSGKIIVRNMFGRQVGAIQMEPKNVLPESVRKLNGTLNKKFLFGKYTAELALINADKQHLTASATFTVFPYKLVILGLMLLFSLYLIFWRRRQRLKKAFALIFGKD